MESDDRDFIIGQIEDILKCADEEQLRVLLAAARAYIKKNL